MSICNENCKRVAEMLKALNLNFSENYHRRIYFSFQKETEGFKPYANYWRFEKPEGLKLYFDKIFELLQNADTDMSAINQELLKQNGMLAAEVIHYKSIIDGLKILFNKVFIDGDNVSIGYKGQTGYYENMSTIYGTNQKFINKEYLSLEGGHYGDFNINPNKNCSGNLFRIGNSQSSYSNQKYDYIFGNKLYKEINDIMIDYKEGTMKSTNLLYNQQMRLNKSSKGKEESIVSAVDNDEIYIEEIARLDKEVAALKEAAVNTATAHKIEIAALKEEMAALDQEHKQKFIAATFSINKYSDAYAQKLVQIGRDKTKLSEENAELLKENSALKSSLKSIKDEMNTAFAAEKSDIQLKIDCYINSEKVATTTIKAAEEKIKNMKSAGIENHEFIREILDQNRELAAKIKHFYSGFSMSKEAAALNEKLEEYEKKYEILEKNKDDLYV